MKIRTLLLFLSLLVLNFNRSAAEDFQSLLADSCLTGAFVGMAIKDLSSDLPIFDHNAELRFSTASNLKLFTSAAALEILGPECRFITSFFTNGNLDKKGHLKGDLIIVGGGDPLISGRFRQSITEVLEYWTDSLSMNGINEIDGDLVIDNMLFESDELGAGWAFDYLSYWYACPISALSFNDNCVDFRALPASAEGMACQISFSPTNKYLTITNQTTTLPAGLENTFDFVRTWGTDNVKFFGGIALDDTNGITDYVSVDDPARYCATVFSDMLKQKSIRLKGDIAMLDRGRQSPRYNYSNLIKIFDWHSDSLGLVISVINKNSQNFFAEQTLKMLGVVIYGEGSYKASIKVVNSWLAEIGLTRDDVGYNDGSGLSPMNLAKPAAIVHLLDYMYHSDNFDTYYESMAIPGIDRSVRSRMASHPLAAKMRTKTGHIANTRTFAGYLTTRSGHLVAFSLMVNNYTAPEGAIDNWLDKVCSFVIDNY